MDFFKFEKYPLLLAGISACCGIYLTVGKSWFYALACLAAVLVVGKIRGSTYKLLISALVVFLLFSCWGFLYSGFCDNSYSRYDGKDCTVSGKIVSVDAFKDRYTLVTVRPEGFMKRKIRAYLFDNEYDFIQGDRISITGKLIKPEGPSNPGGYDSRKFLYGDGITAIIFCDREDVKYIEGFSIGHIFGLMDKSISDKCKKLLGDERGSLVNAMLIGNKTHLDPSLKESFRDSGLSHTMAVSGSHVAYILVPLYFLFSKIGVERRKYYPWLIGLLVFFAMLAGMQPSVLRAGITASIMLLGGIVNRNPEPLNSLSASALILMAINPFSIFDAGFILSYSSVLSILVFYKPLAGIIGRGPVGAMVSMSIAVQLGLLPVTAKLFYSIQVFSVFANIIIFPVRALLAVLGWLMYFASLLSMQLAGLIASIVQILADAMASTAVLFSSSELSVINVPYVHPLVVAIYFAALMFLFYGRKNKAIPVLAATVSITLYFLFWAVPLDTWIFLDSGKADCFIIKTSSGRDIVIDTGEYMAGNSIAHFTGDYIDAIFLSHAHEDHIGGLFDILERFRVGVVYIPGCSNSEMEEVIKACNMHNVPCVPLLAGDLINADGCVLEIFNPVNTSYLSLNDTSMVIKLTCGDKSLLLCGDAEAASEMDMLARGCNLKADVLKVPHHGALNAAEPRFIEAVGARIAVISCGANDPAHPHEKTLERLKGCDVYRNDLCGAIIIRLGNSGYKVITEK